MNHSYEHMDFSYTKSSICFCISEKVSISFIFVSKECLGNISKGQIAMSVIDKLCFTSAHKMFKHV